MGSNTKVRLGETSGSTRAVYHPLSAQRKRVWPSRVSTTISKPKTHLTQQGQRWLNIATAVSAVAVCRQQSAKKPLQAQPLYVQPQHPANQLQLQPMICRISAATSGTTATGSIPVRNTVAKYPATIDLQLSVVSHKPHITSGCTTQQLRVLIDTNTKCQLNHSLNALNSSGPGNAQQTWGVSGYSRSHT